jgi:hypothetical protein
MIAALYVMTDGPYFGLPNVDPYDKGRDARGYSGPYPVVAHPPCERWGRYWSGGPSAKVRRRKGDDGGCFDRALWAVRNFGGVLEHPAHSSAFDYYGLGSPQPKGWHLSRDCRGWICQVSQGHYGHAAEKRTWLYANLGVEYASALPGLKWGRCEGKRRLDEGFHSKEERQAARARGQKPLKRLSDRENLLTPIPFRDLLISIAEAARP